MASKNIVICSDGTGNSANKRRGTNVFKLFEAVDVNGHTGLDQVVYYDDGVGTESFRWRRILTGATGIGLARNVRQAYEELCRQYEPGDKIYLFGFSRGAFTVRTLVGLIEACGIVDLATAQRKDLRLPWFPRTPPTSRRWLERAARRAWRLHRRRHRAWLARTLLPFLDDGAQITRAFRARYAYGKDERNDPRIHFIGVWDTVGAMAVPFETLRRFLNRFVYRFSFPNTRLPAPVEKACHAVAIDEERHAFEPTLWDEPASRLQAEPCRCDPTGIPQPAAGEPLVEQVWFAGVHSNVGGGYPKQGVSLVALRWMMHKAEAHGLRFNPSAWKSIQEQPNVHDELYDSRGGLAHLYLYRPRDMRSHCDRHGALPRVHVSALERIARATRGYAPPALPADAQIDTAPAGMTVIADAFKLRVADFPPPDTHALERRRQILQWTFNTAAFAAFLDALARLGAGALFEAVYTAPVSPLETLSALWRSAPLEVGLFLTVAGLVWAGAKHARSRIEDAREAYWRQVFPGRR